MSADNDARTAAVRITDALAGWQLGDYGNERFIRREEAMEMADEVMTELAGLLAGSEGRPDLDRAEIAYLRDLLERIANAMQGEDGEQIVVMAEPETTTDVTYTTPRGVEFALRPAFDEDTWSDLLSAAYDYEADVAARRAVQEADRVGRKHDKAIRALERAEAREVEKARTMLGLPNDIARQEGYASGISYALRLYGRPQMADARQCHEATGCHDHKVNVCGCETHFLPVQWRSVALHQCPDHARAAAVQEATDG